MQAGDLVRVKRHHGGARHLLWQIVTIDGARARLERWARERHIETQAVVGDLELVRACSPENGEPR